MTTADKNTHLDVVETATGGVLDSNDGSGTTPRQQFRDMFNSGYVTWDFTMVNTSDNDITIYGEGVNKFSTDTAVSGWGKEWNSTIKETYGTGSIHGNSASGIGNANKCAILAFYDETAHDTFVILVGNDSTGGRTSWRVVLDGTTYTVTLAPDFWN